MENDNKFAQGLVAGVVGTSVWGFIAYMIFHVCFWLIMKKYKVSLHVTQEINAKSQDDALGIFWDDFNRNQVDDENAYVYELCPKYNDEVLPDENGNCSLCGKHKAE